MLFSFSAPRKDDRTDRLSSICIIWANHPVLSGLSTLPSLKGTNFFQMCLFDPIWGAITLPVLSHHRWDPSLEPTFAVTSLANELCADGITILFSNDLHVLSVRSISRVTSIVLRYLLALAGQVIQAGFNVAFVIIHLFPIKGSFGIQGTVRLLQLYQLCLSSLTVSTLISDILQHRTRHVETYWLLKLSGCSSPEHWDILRCTDLI